jgi:hypothetical protein
MTDLRLRPLVILAAVLAGPVLAGAAPVTEGPFQGVRRGDRVRLVLSSKIPFLGIVRSVTAGHVCLDLRWEERGVEGTMTFTADRVRKVEVLTAWDVNELEERRVERLKRLQDAEADLKRIADERESVRQAEAAARAKAETPAAGGAAGAAKKGSMASAGGLTAEEKERGIELLKEFPPTEGWGSDKDKTLDWLTVKFATVGAALTPAEQRFVENYSLWLKAKDAMQSPETPAAGAEPPAAGPPAGSAAPATTPAPAATPAAPPGPPASPAPAPRPSAPPPAPTGHSG